MKKYFRQVSGEELINFCEEKYIQDDNVSIRDSVIFCEFLKECRSYNNKSLDDFEIERMIIN